ncbi:exopolyphosphatase [Thioflexithrix psekupsensis]|uniref:Exopolyphosphatase n=1 Tax=Thioflexithrix psekupsensis TaxID=1570016 RepID=A0A251X7F4_9GAMM|nr:exopolyphosphatase [Thioflexithrix psekupsensis]OUD13119.1 exopolyphosphatase [Thioflexithrix psekupsensis]
MFKLPPIFHHAEPEVVAAVDLGSNSFHMIVARINHGQVHLLDRMKESVRLGAGLNAQRQLSAESQQRALECLARFGQRLRHMPVDSVRIVGTNTLRLAVNAPEFLSQVERTLGHPVEIISGREEARLIYLGVAHTLSSISERRLVIDIGGGSTELIIGEGFEPLCAESLCMGCVSMTQRHFAEGEIKAKSLRQAEIAALLELQPVESLFRKTGWEVVIGASGTMRSVQKVLQEMGWGNGISLRGLQQLRDLLLTAGHIEQLKFKNLSPQRLPVFVGGVAVVLGLFEGLGLSHIHVSEGALREGLVYDMLGRITHEDVREQTIQALISRYSIDLPQAERVEETALTLLAHVATQWQLAEEKVAQTLSWAARLHEIGLSISHEHYHKHGAYLLTHSDLAGFSRQEQTVLATLVRVHRRKITSELCTTTVLPLIKVIRLATLLRLAVLLHRSRSANYQAKLSLSVSGDQLRLQFPAAWLSKHPLTFADLEQEQLYLKEIGMTLLFE